VHCASHWNKLINEWAAKLWVDDICICIWTGTVLYCNHGMCLQPKFTLMCNPAAGPTVHKDRRFSLQACFPIISVVCLELTATNSFDQRLCLLKSRLKTFFICSGFHWTLIRPATSASEITTIWRYINFIIIIIKCKVLCERWKHTMASLGSIQSEITWSSWPSSYWIGALLALATVTRFNHHIVCHSVIPCGFHL